MLNEMIAKSLLEAGCKNEGRYILAFSSGPDSTALAYLLKEHGYQDVTLIYINYHDSPLVKQEEEMVVKVSEDLGYKLIMFNEEIPKNLNFESAARRIRYQHFAKVYRSIGATAIFTGHHKDDDAETLALQLERGGFVDYYGLAPSTIIDSSLVVRPLLKISKLELVEYLKQKNISYFDDPTNSLDSRKRNVIRKKLTPSATQELLQRKEKLNKKYEASRLLIDSLTTKFIRNSDYASLQEDEKKMLIVKFLKLYFCSIEAKLLSSLTKKVYFRLKVDRPFREHLADNKYLYRNKEEFFISDKMLQGDYHYQIDKPGRYNFKEFFIDLSEPAIFNVLFFPLTIGNLKQGDQLATGLKQKNVRNFIKKMGVPNYLVDFYPVFKNANEEVIYVPFFSDIKKGLIPFKLHNFR